MTPEERDISFGLVMNTSGVQRVSKEEFLRRFPSSLEDGHVASRLLQEAYQTRNAEDLQCALLIGFTFGFAAEQIDLLCRLLEADWHHSHEDIVEALDDFRTPNAIDALFRATQWIPEYLDFDDARALAVKAIWALGNLPGNDATEKLQILASSKESILRKNARYQLKLRRERT